MNKILLFSLFALFSLQLQAQQKAVTETGDEVILYEDGTWTYVDEEAADAKEIPLNPETFTKPKSSSFLLKSKTVENGIYLNPKKWIFKKSTDNPDAEYEFQMKEGDLYGMLITEKIEIPLETLRGIALMNGQSVSPDLRVVNEEYRMVNGKKVLHLQMNGTLQGIKFSYYGYYYSDEGGTTQFITYTSQMLLEEYTDEADELLNGLVSLLEDE